ncbi:MAG: 4-hydroxythreonine-4-phosphate dehydrogenase PdxA [Blastopirellula sp.]|nr:MAG: 4-hydroxythreonine-4-phosphate dehydrogenase PdxA [Blastopirellula sp.]
MTQKPRIAITTGDPAGIGPEVCLQLLNQPSLLELCTPIFLGDAALLKRVSAECQLPFCENILPVDAWEDSFHQINEPAILDFGLLEADKVVAGQVAAECGLASYRYIEKAIELANCGQVAAVTTGPINKESLQAAGIKYPGHTEIFADQTNTPNYCMMQTCDQLSCTFVTTHVGYAEVQDLISTQRILEVLRLSHQAMLRIRGEEPTLIVCGLNPHAGENGLFGNREEENFIIPAIEQARAEGMTIVGPLPPDTAFLPARRTKNHCTVCMYHDQGHIPLKALAFDLAVNVTLGLPIIRTSVDHGTAYDIARTGGASPSSLIEAVKLAVRLSCES